jgi:hypothetical protein
MTATARTRSAASRGAPFVVGAAVAVATTAVAVVDPHEPGRYPICPLFALTGLACPLCGGLRATHDLAHLDLAGAWSANALWTVAAPLLVAAWVWWVFRTLRPAPAPAAASRALRVDGATIAVLLLVLATVFAVVRNLPGPAAALTPWA